VVSLQNLVGVWKQTCSNRYYKTSTRIYSAKENSSEQKPRSKSEWQWRTRHYRTQTKECSASNQRAQLVRFKKLTTTSPRRTSPAYRRTMLDSILLGQCGYRFWSWWSEQKVLSVWILSIPGICPRRELITVWIRLGVNFSIFRLFFGVSCFLIRLEIFHYFPRTCSKYRRRVCFAPRDGRRWPRHVGVL